MTMIIDATNLIAGRLATTAAKKALNGEEVHIINAEKAVISGSKSHLVGEFRRKRQSKDIANGPFFPRMPDRMLKRIIRGMLPYKTPTGRAALARIKCHVGVPSELAGQQGEGVKGAEVSKIITGTYVSLEQLSRRIGGMK